MATLEKRRREAMPTIYLSSTSRSLNGDTGLMHQHIVGTPFGRIAIDVAGSFPEIERGKRYL
jgi:hypothetical protein